MTIKMIASSAIITMIICCLFLFSYLSVPAISYAEDTNQETYVNVDNDNDALAGVIAYLNYRGLGFLSNNINAVRALLSDSQVELSEFYDTMKKTPAGILRFTYNAQALLQLNQIAQYYIDKYGILNYDSSASPVTEIVYSGKKFTDLDGNECLCFIRNPSGGWPVSYASPDYSGLTFGTPLKYSKLDYADTYSFNLLDNYSYSLTPNSGSFTRDGVSYFGQFFPNYSAFSRNSAFKLNDCCRGYFSVCVNGDHLSFIIVQEMSQPLYNDNVVKLTLIQNLDDVSGLTDVGIDIHTPKGIGPAPDPDIPVTPRKTNGDTYNYNEGDTYIDNSVENNTYYYVYPSDPGGGGEDPGGGGEDPGGGGDDPGGGGGESGGGESGTGCNCPDYTSKFDQIIAQLNQILGIEQPDYTEQLDDILDYYATWQTTLDTISDDIDSIKSLVRLIYLALTSPQDFDPGDLVDYDFGLPVNLDQKFPFCIPFDLLIFSRLMMTEPETPHFEGTIDLHIYQWQIDFDFSDFDDLAEKVRAVEFLAFLVGLMILTMKLFKG